MRFLEIDESNRTWSVRPTSINYLRVNWLNCGYAERLRDRQTFPMMPHS